MIYYIYAAHHLDFTTPNLIMLCEEILGETGFTMTVFSVSCLQVGRAWSCLEWWNKELVRLWWFWCQISSDSFLHSIISSMRSSRASLELLSILISCLHSDSKCFEHVLRQSKIIPQRNGRGMVLFHLILSLIAWLKCYIAILKELSIHKRRASRVNNPNPNPNTSEQSKCKYSVVSSCLLSWYYSTTRELIASMARGMYDGYTTSCTSAYRRRQQCSPRSLVPSTTFSFLSFKFKGHTVTHHHHACMQTRQSWSFQIKSVMVMEVLVGKRWYVLAAGTYNRLLALTC